MDSTLYIIPRALSSVLATLGHYSPGPSGLYIEDTTKGPRDYIERRIHWTSGITILELTRYNTRVVRIKRVA